MRTRKVTKSGKHTLALQLKPELYRRIVALADEDERSPSSYVIRFLKENLPEEDATDAEEDEEEEEEESPRDKIRSAVDRAREERRGRLPANL